MDTQTQTFKGDMAAPSPKRKKGRAWLVILIIVLAAAAGTVFYFFIQRQNASKPVKELLKCAQEMKLDSMAALLQNGDITVLDEADIRDEAYSAFFASINSKMEYEISKTKVDIANGSGEVTAHIKYIDGSEIYKETITEFLRQIVSTAFSGESLSEKETKTTLSSILMEKSKGMENKFLETDITYPVIKTEEGWKVLSLDEKTAEIMSANFKSVEDELTDSLVEMEEGKTAAPSTEAAPTPGETDTINMDTEKFSVQYKSHKKAKDFGGNPCVLVYYNYTNNGTSPSSAMVDVSIQAYQNSEACQAAIPGENDPAIDRFMEEIQPGETATVCQAFSLKGAGDVTLQASEAFSFTEGATTSQILKIQ